MKRYVLIGAGLMLLAGSGAALAQMPPGGPEGEDGPHHGPMGGPMMEHGPMMGGPMMRHWGHRGPMSGGAAFHFKKGDMEIGVRCSENEPTYACVQAVGELLGKLNGTASSTPDATTAPTTPPSR